MAEVVRDNLSKKAVMSPENISKSSKGLNIQPRVQPPAVYLHYINFEHLLATLEQ